MNQMTHEQSEKLEQLYANGQFEGIAPTEINLLTESDAQHLIAEAARVAPGTFTPIDPDTRAELLTVIDNGELPFRRDDIRFLSIYGAQTLLWMTMSPDNNHEYAISRPQQKRIKALIAKGFLHKLTSVEILQLSEKKAQRLIQQGEKNALYERNGE